MPFTDLHAPLLFTAPEALDGCYGPPADIWAAGVVLYIALCGVPPFWAAILSHMRRVLHEQELAFRSPKWRDVSEDAKQLLCLLLAKDPSKRLTASEALGECCSDEGL